MRERVRGFELISEESLKSNNQLDCEYSDLLKRIKMPARGTLGSAGYDLFNNTDKKIVIKSGEISNAIPTYIKSYMQDDEYLAIHVRSGHGFKYSVKLVNTTGIIDCVPAGTKIQTPKGEVNVESLMNTNNTEIFAYNEQEQKIEVDNIDDIWIVNDLKLLKIETDDYCIEVPVNKEIFTKRGWIKAELLNINDEILAFK